MSSMYVHILLRILHYDLKAYCTHERNDVWPVGFDTDMQDCARLAEVTQRCSYKRSNCRTVC